MPIDAGKYREVLAGLGERVKLVAVSKTQPVEDIKALYDLGQRDFGENYVQELLDKQAQLPADIRWHFIGHLQSNKVKYITPFVYLIQGVDSTRLLKEIDKQATRGNRRISCLLQVHIAREETKFGLDVAELAEVMPLLSSASDGSAAGLNESSPGSNRSSPRADKSSLDSGKFSPDSSKSSPGFNKSSPVSGGFPEVDVLGLMGMASFTEDPEKARTEFHTLKSLFDQYFRSAVTPAGAPILSMGMSGDYKIAVEEGSNMVRIGSLLFGKRR